MINPKTEFLFFKKAVVLSLIAHLLLFVLIILSPYFPSFSHKGMVHYVNVISLPGGGESGGGSGSPGGGQESKQELVETEASSRETLADLITSQNLEQQQKSSLRHPTKEVQKEKDTSSGKKPVIKKQEKISSKSSSSDQESSSSEKGTGSGSGSGSGLRVGIGSGSGFSSQIGLSNFPYTYYLQIIIDRVSGNWFKSLVSPGTRGDYYTTVFFKIYQNGQISDLKIEESSGIDSLDLTALRAIRTSAPFPPLPRAYNEKYLGIHLIFEHSQ